VATVLIAAPEYLTVLKARPELGDAIAFADADVLQALEAITSLRPAVVVLEKQFADTSRGAALINRIKADQSLRPCDIQIVLHGGHAIEHVQTAPEPAVQDAPALAPIDYRGTRRAERFAIKPGVEVQIEGGAAQLVNLSAVGAQVLSSSIVKPNQRVRLALSAQPGTARITSLVAWASFELPRGVARYRAGIEFLPPFDHAAVTKFIKKHKV
jgi:CheY-like chemotaxis protein